MASLSTKKKLYCEANSKVADFTNNVILQDDMVGGVSAPYIKTWSVDGLAKPTDEQLASYEADADKEESNNQVRSKRKSEYGDIGDQLDEIYHDQDAWKTRIAKVKADNPKA